MIYSFWSRGCPGGRGAPATWIIRKGHGTTFKFENAKHHGQFLKIGQGGQYTVRLIWLYHYDTAFGGNVSCWMGQVQCPGVRLHADAVTCWCAVMKLP